MLGREHVGHGSSIAEPLRPLLVIGEIHEADGAFEWLDKAVEYGDPGIGEIVTESLFDNIHADPRWLAFLRKLGKAPEQLAKIEFKVTLPPAEGAAASGGSNK